LGFWGAIAFNGFMCMLLRSVTYCLMVAMAHRGDLVADMLGHTSTSITRAVLLHRDVQALVEPVKGLVDSMFRDVDRGYIEEWDSNGPVEHQVQTCEVWSSPPSRATRKVVARTEAEVPTRRGQPSRRKHLHVRQHSPCQPQMRFLDEQRAGRSPSFAPPTRYPSKPSLSSGTKIASDQAHRLRPEIPR